MGDFAAHTTRREHSARCSVTSKTSPAHATVVTNDELCYVFFGHVYRRTLDRNLFRSIRNSTHDKCQQLFGWKLMVSEHGLRQRQQVVTHEHEYDTQNQGTLTRRDMCGTRAGRGIACRGAGFWFVVFSCQLLTVQKLSFLVFRFKFLVSSWLVVGSVWVVGSWEMRCCVSG